MVFQNYALYPQMTVAQNLGFALELARLGEARSSRKSRQPRPRLGSSLCSAVTRGNCPAVSGSVSPWAGP